MPELNNLKRKRANRFVVNLDGNCTPSDSETDEEEEHDRITQRKICRRQSNTSENVIDGESSDSVASSENENCSNQGNNQLLLAALRKIQELENELAELDEAGYDSGHQDEDDVVDEGDVSSGDIDAEHSELHNHRTEILNGQAEALGFAFCVKETFEYLAAQGIAQDNPIITTLRNRFLGQCNPN